MKNKWLISVIGCAATLLGGMATLASNWAEERKTEEMIDTKIREALAERDEKESDEDDEDNES